jgi:hypothetical protein
MVCLQAHANVTTLLLILLKMYVIGLASRCVARCLTSKLDNAPIAEPLLQGRGLTASA